MPAINQHAGGATLHEPRALVVGTPDQFSKDEEVPLQHGLDDVQALSRQLLADPDVRQVLPRVAFSGLISSKEHTVPETWLNPMFLVRNPSLQ